MTRLLFVACVVALTAFGDLDSFAANSKAGTHAYPFLKIPVGAKAPAMAGAYAGLSDDVSGIYFNPAGIIQVTGSEVSGSYNNYLAGIQGGYLSYLIPWGTEGKLGIAVNYLNYGSTPKTDVNGDRIDEFGGGDVAISFTVARMWPNDTDESYEIAESHYEDQHSHPHWSGLSVGITGKFVYETLDVYSSDALAVDIGVMYGLKDNRTRLGLSASNLGFQLKGLSSEHKDALPAILRAGIGHQLKAAPAIIAIDAIKPFDNDFFFAAGLNYTNFYPLEIRAGYSTLGEDFKTGSDKDKWGGFSLGFGLKLNRLILDYGFIPYADLGTSHRVAISTRW
jgi:hypothetical protein